MNKIWGMKLDIFLSDLFSFIILPITFYFILFQFNF